MSMFSYDILFIPIEGGPERGSLVGYDGSSTGAPPPHVPPLEIAGLMIRAY